MCQFDPPEVLVEEKIKTHEEYLLVYYTNILKRIKNDRLKPEEISDIFDEHLIEFHEKFGKIFQTELYLFNDKRYPDFTYHCVEDNDKNRKMYSSMKSYFKEESQQIIKRISQLKFA